ncbi:curli assembly protein CsgF [Vibrio rumoiensis]|uniref:Curli production assembly/transport component CsgF n=1 Tax=Vibrio rumoiensis 1S-45 TaxID=1188252 RepID=A0A1E5DZ83_9VIBR|nr:curli assembly protein CsgF [Vibrio rumoiensis]OEF23160.1 curli production assembly protein CsgF [Vibrio rumoiensis 1S-45]
MKYINKWSVVISICLYSQVGSATEMVYTPINPSFGGNPLYTSHLMGVANAINDYKGPSTDNGFEEESALDRLAANLESRLISQLLGDVGNGNSGQLETSDFILNIVDSNGRLTVQIVDKGTGETSEIQVSGLNPDL